MEASGSVPRESELDDDSRWEALEATLPLVYVAEFDRAGTLRYISGVVQRWTGHAPSEFLGDIQLWYDCIHVDDVDRVRDAEQRLFDSKEQLNLEYRMVGPDGEARWVWERNTIVRDGRGAPICTHGTIVDLSGFNAEELSDRGVGAHTPLLMRRDFLTGLPSRQVLSEHLELALARAQRDGRVVALLDIDLDRFRAVNDAVGHSGGDVVLTQVVSRLRQHVPAGDLLLHGGGDEFLMMLCGIEAELADAVVAEMGERISETLLTPFEVAGKQLEVRASIGYALGPDDGREPDELHRAAHAGVAAAKLAGRGELRRYQPGEADALRRMSVDYRLRRAIEQNAVKPYFQPIIDLETGLICAAEALARWETPDGEVLLPERFVPAAEESSLIIDLDVHMVRAVAGLARRLKDLELALPLHVNVSSRIVSWHGFVRAVLQAIDVAGIEPRDLTLELTETAAIRDPSASVALSELAGEGIGLAMDDFGSAYSSIARLRVLPVRIVKLDRTMVLAVTGQLPPSERIGPASDTIEAGTLALAGVLRMGRELGIQTIVEGVETAQVRDLIKTFGANRAQGYFFARPAPFEDLVGLLRQPGR